MAPIALITLLPCGGVHGQRDHRGRFRASRDQPIRLAQVLRMANNWKLTSYQNHHYRWKSIAFPLSLKNRHYFLLKKHYYFLKYQFLPPYMTLLSLGMTTKRIQPP